MKQVKFKITNIDYDLQSQLSMKFPNWKSFPEAKLQQILSLLENEISNLPKQLFVVLDKKILDQYEPADKSEPIWDKILEVTGWCTKSFNFNQIKEHKNKNQRV